MRYQAVETPAIEHNPGCLIQDGWAHDPPHGGGGDQQRDAGLHFSAHSVIRRCEFVGRAQGSCVCLTRTPDADPVIPEAGVSALVELLAAYERHRSRAESV